MTWRRSLPWLVLFAALGAVGAGILGPLGGGGRSVSPGGRMEGRVTRVVDGDTVKVWLGGRPQTVRYIGMDTPETVKPNTPVQCFGKSASAENAHLVGGARVTLRLGAEPRDRYGRLLAYVYRGRDGLFVNAALVRGGFARTLTIPPNVAHARELGRLQAAAHAAGRGLWGACGG
jgi:micrococcal nuclease